MAATAECLERYTERAGCLWDGDLCVTEKMTDELLAFAYLRFQNEGLLPYLFYEGHPPGVKWFIEEYSKRDMLGCFKREADGVLTLGGLTWLNVKVPVGDVFTKAECGQGFFREYHNRRETLRWARLSAAYAFKFLAVDVLYGTTPVKNRAAVIAAKRVGFQVVCEIPHYTAWEGKPCAVALSYLTRERLEEIQEGG